MRRLAALITSLALAGCAPWNVDAQPVAKKCQVWVRIDNGSWHCYERGEILRELSRTTSTP